MAHELACSLQQMGGIWQRCALKETHVYVRREYVDVAKGRIAKTRHRTAVVHKFTDFVAALAHLLKPSMREVAQFACVCFHPCIDGGIVHESAVESQQICFHDRAILEPGLVLYWFGRRFG